jgi:hypothetical protein
MKIAEANEAFLNTFLVFEELRKIGLNAFLIGATCIPFIIDELTLEEPLQTNDVDVSILARI